MTTQELASELDRLESQAHEVEDRMHGRDTGCMTFEVDHLRQELIDTTIKIDEIKEELGQCIEEEY